MFGTAQDNVINTLTPLPRITHWFLSHCWIFVVFVYIYLFLTCYFPLTVDLEEVSGTSAERSLQPFASPLILAPRTALEASTAVVTATQLQALLELPRFFR